MFTKIELKGLRKSPRFGYAADLPFFKGRRHIEFKPGLNVLYGPNGCGKSTVLRMLGETMCATQGGVSAVTEAALRESVDVGFGSGRCVDQIALHVLHDGQPVLYCDPRKAVGIAGGSFDQDFLKEGLTELFDNKSKSHGQASASRMAAALDVLEGKARLPAAPLRKLSASGLNDLWKKALSIVDARMAPSIEPGQITILLDEPEANFSLKWQAMLWALVSDPSVLERCQIIVASHSPFVLGLPAATYLDLVPDYRQDMQALLTGHFQGIRPVA